MKRYIYYLLLLFILGCSEVNQDKLFSMSQKELVDTENVTVRWLAIDDNSQMMNYSLYSDNIIISQGYFPNNTMVEWDMTTNINKTSRRIVLYVEDGSRNVGYAYVVVNITDKTYPIVKQFEVVKR